jgi:hypothetical protein
MALIRAYHQGLQLHSYIQTCSMQREVAGTEMLLFKVIMLAIMGHHRLETLGKLIAAGALR